MAKVLIVDDDQAIVTLLKYTLEANQFEVVTADNGKTALTLAENAKFDAILLDLMLPQLDGLSVTKQLRAEQNLTPILMITAKGSEADRIYGLELGADDYLTKPFSPDEVVARIKAVMRRTSQGMASQPSSTGLVIGPLTINETTHKITVAGQPVSLTKTEYTLLMTLVNHRNQVLSREQLLELVWSANFSGDTRMVDIHISHLREKLEVDPKHPTLITTVRGFGYRLEGE